MNKPSKLPRALPALLAMTMMSAAVAAPAVQSDAALLPAANAAALTQQLQSIAAKPAIPLSSLSVVAIRAGSVVYSAQFGDKRVANAAGPAQAADDRTMYRIASISKMVTTLGVMKLVEQGKLSLDADVGTYLGYPLRNPNFPDQAITLRMLLSHTSSLRDDGGYSWDPAVAIKDVLVPGGARYGKGASWAKNAGPGSFFSYVNLNWGVIGTIMEKAGGERFDRLMRRLLLDPMAIRGGFYPPEFSAQEIADVATLYRKRTTDDKEIWNPDGPWIAQTDDFGTAPPQARSGVAGYVVGSNGTVFGPQGGLRISAAGLAKIMLMMMNGGRDGDKQILKPESLAAMLARQWTDDGRSETNRGLFRAWGLGIQHFEDGSVVTAGAAGGDRLVDAGQFKAVGHLGDAWGLKSAFVYDPKTRNGMIYIVGGVGANPETQRGAYSSNYRFEEQILSALYRQALLREPPQNK